MKRKNIILLSSVVLMLSSCASANPDSSSDGNQSHQISTHSSTESQGKQTVSEAMKKTIFAMQYYAEKEVIFTSYTGTLLGREVNVGYMWVSNDNFYVFAQCAHTNYYHISNLCFYTDYLTRDNPQVQGMVFFTSLPYTNKYYASNSVENELFWINCGYSSTSTISYKYPTEVPGLNLSDCEEETAKLVNLSLTQLSSFMASHNSNIKYLGFSNY